MDLILTAVFRKVPEGYIGLVEELPGANSRERTPRERRETTRADPAPGRRPGAHITSDGNLESHADVMRRLVQQFGLSGHDLFRSADELIADAYRIQGERIAYVPTANKPDDQKPLEGASR